MSGKTGFIILILLTAAAASVTAHETSRTAFIITGEQDRDRRDLSENDDSSLRFWGLETETIMDDTGFGMDGLVNFYTDSLNNSMMDWRGQLFMRYHLFGDRSFLDPFMEAGIGNAGTVRLEDGEELQMSLYPYLSAGGNLLFHEGFYAGIKWSYNIDEWIIPGTVIPKPELEKHQVTFTVGYSYSWHDYYHHEDHHHYHFD